MAPQGGPWMPPQGGTWVPAQGGGWVCASSSQYMQPQPLPTPQLTLDSVDRAERRRKRKVSDADVKGRVTVGKKPNQVRVKAGGEIAGGHGKNAWDAAVRTFVPRILDMSVLSWEGQSTSALNLLRERLDRDFEYVGYSLSENGFRNAVKRFMKTERSRLKVKYREGHKECPVHIEEDQWNRLIKYWDTDDHKEKSRKMSIARGSVKTLSIVGRKGIDGREADLVSSNILTSTR